jgi:hypothetical protein
MQLSGGGRNRTSDRAAQLPDIVRSFADRAVPGGVIPRTIRLRQAAEMRLTPIGSWHRLTAEPVIGLGEPGFVWLGRMRMTPFVSANVLDAYVAGRPGCLGSALVWIGKVRMCDRAGGRARRIDALARGATLGAVRDAAQSAPAMVARPSLSCDAPGTRVASTREPQPAVPGQPL